jgi:hypothetical protein
MQYAIRHNIRHNRDLRSDDLIKKVAGLVDERHKVNLSKPDKVILVEVFQVRSFSCFFFFFLLPTSHLPSAAPSLRVISDAFKRISIRLANGKTTALLRHGGRGWKRVGESEEVQRE